MPEDLGTLLDGYQVSVLQSIAAAAGIDTKRGGRSLSRGELIALLRRELFREERVRTAWQELDDGERRIVNRLLLHGGAVSSRSFKRELLRADLVTPTPTRAGQDNVWVSYTQGYAGHPKRRQSMAFEDVMARLTLRGLVFSRLAIPRWGGPPPKLDFHPGTMALVPEAVRRFLPEPEPVPPPLTGWEPQRVEVGAPDLMVRDLYLYWDQARRSPAPLIQTGLVGKRWLKGVNDLILVRDASLEAAKREDETERLYLLRQLLEGLGLLAMREATLSPTSEPTAIPAFWALTSVEQRAACLRLWSGVEEPRTLADPAAASPFTTNAKRALLKALAQLPAGVWLEPGELLDRAADLAGGSLLFGSRGDLEEYYISSGGAWEQPEEGAEVEQRLVDGWLHGFLLAIGLVELGYDGDRLRAFRVTPDGAALLREPPEGASRHAAPPPADGASIVVQPNFQVLAMGPVPLATLARLDLVATRQCADAAAFEYLLTRESVYAAQQIGVSAAEVARILREITGSELPQNVSRTLEEWGAHHERIVFHEGVTLVHAADADLLERLMQDVGAHLGLRAVGPDVALLRRDRQEAFVTALFERGLLPAVSDMRPESADRSVIVTADGAIEPIHAVPSLYLRDRLARFAEPAGHGRWQLTPRSVRRATGSKAKVLGLLQELGALQRGDLPDGLAEQLRVWGCYYGAAAVETLTLVEFSDQETLDELLARPELRGALRPLAPGRGKRALAVVDEGQREYVEETLRRLGVRLGGAIAR